MKCDLGVLTLECLRKLSTSDVLNFMLEYELEHSFPPNTPLPLLLPIMPWSGFRVTVSANMAQFDRLSF